MKYSPVPEVALIFRVAPVVYFNGWWFYSPVRTIIYIIRLTDIFLVGSKRARGLAVSLNHARALLQAPTNSITASTAAAWGVVKCDSRVFMLPWRFSAGNAPLWVWSLAICITRGVLIVSLGGVAKWIRNEISISLKMLLGLATGRYDVFVSLLLMRNLQRKKVLHYRKCIN